MVLTSRILGLVVIAVLAAAGLAAAALVLPLLLALGAVTVCAVLCVRRDDARLAASRFGRHPIPYTAGAVAVLYAVIGMTVLLGGATTALAAAATLAVLGYRHLRRRTGHPDEPEASPAEAGAAGRSEAAEPRPDSGDRRQLPRDPGTVPTAQLCRAWRVSYLVLQNARGIDALADAADLRRHYLDELERRDPHGFRRWLDDGARAASDPSRYLQLPRGRDHHQDDEDQAV